MPRSPHFVFAGGGSPGHLYPGLAVAAYLMERMPDAAVTFVGSGGASDRHAIRAAGFAYAKVPSQPSPQNALHAVRFVTDNVAGYWAARWFLKERRAAAVVGLGGTSSAPTVRAAISRGIPTVLLEQNVVPSRVTRWLSRSATSVCIGFSESRAYFPSAVPLTVTGNPARPVFEQLYRESRNTQQHACGKRLTVVAGARGARSINERVPRAMARLRDQLSGWQIVHQTGEGQLQETEERYQLAGVDALVVAFIDEIAPILFESDLVVCRAGGTTLAELALAGAPAILVPGPRVMEYHLPAAEIFVSAGAARIINEAECEGSLENELVAQLEPLLVNDFDRQKMAANMRHLARPDAADRVTDAICEALVRTCVPLAA